MRFRVLGPLEVIGAAGRLLFAPRQRIVLSMLLLEPNRVVSVERLVDAVWGTAPPSTSATPSDTNVPSTSGTSSTETTTSTATSTTTGTS
ncbi:hypothetical protein ACFQ1S_23250 [Kibdelosporangium lantanae]|uniref:OmpR/PhoB-type domain-containing protein n=1 Tax=Kibdelosporangium lantanae TaxID=1497396 RepID=A0ABW3MEX7_9PSEU